MRPRLLDLYCGAGGAARGYHDAGFDVVGVDIAPQPRYPYEFVQQDALDYLSHLDNWVEVGGTIPFDAIHASPPCQGYSVANNIHGRTDHPLMISETRAALKATGLPYIIENVPGALKHMENPVVLCGLSFGLNVKRHRLFETNWPLLVQPCTNHDGDWLLVFGHSVLERGTTVGVAKGGRPVIRRKSATTQRGRDAMGIQWMNRDELSEAIPPAYTEYIGRALLDQLHARSAAPDAAHPSPGLTGRPETEVQ